MYIQCTKFCAIKADDSQEIVNQNLGAFFFFWPTQFTMSIYSPERGYIGPDDDELFL